MRRIETAPAQDTWCMRVECTGSERNTKKEPCGQHWEVKEGDLTVETVCVMGEYDTERIGIVCPECGTFTELPYYQVPEVIRNRCLTRYRNEQREAAKSRGGFFGWLSRLCG